MTLSVLASPRAAPLPALEPRRGRPRPRRPMTEQTVVRPASAPRAGPIGRARARSSSSGSSAGSACSGSARRSTPATPPKAGFDLELLLRAGRDVAAGRSPYDPALVAGTAPVAESLFYSYPPVVAQLMAAFAAIPSPVMLVAWDAAAVAGLAAVAVALARRFAPGPAVPLGRPAGRRPRPALLPVRDRAAVRQPRRVLPAPVRGDAPRGRAGHDATPSRAPAASPWRPPRSRSSTRPRSASGSASAASAATARAVGSSSSRWAIGLVVLVASVLDRRRHGLDGLRGGRPRRQQRRPRRPAERRAGRPARAPPRRRGRVRPDGADRRQPGVSSP